MSKFKVGDVVERVSGTYRGMHVGEQDEVAAVDKSNGIKLKIHSPDRSAYHDASMFKLAQPPKPPSHAVYNCPFCGRDDLTIVGAEIMKAQMWIECRTCAAAGPESEVLNEVIALWNNNGNS